MRDQQCQALLAYAEENYAHARDHEHLRAQVTSILSAGSTVLFGFGLERLGTSSQTALLTGAVVAVLGLLNLRLNFLHNNRFEAHVAAANAALRGVEGRSNEGPDGEVNIQKCRDAFDKIKRGSLSMTWNFLPLLMIVLGIIIVGLSLTTAIFPNIDLLLYDAIFNIVRFPGRVSA